MLRIFMLCPTQTDPRHTSHPVTPGKSYTSYTFPSHGTVNTLQPTGPGPNRHHHQPVPVAPGPPHLHNSTTATNNPTNLVVSHRITILWHLPPPTHAPPTNTTTRARKQPPHHQSQIQLVDLKNSRPVAPVCLCVLLKQATLHPFLGPTMGLVTSCFKSPLPALPRIDVPKMMGTWYVIAVLPTPFEKGAFNPTEKYTWNAEKKNVAVEFTFNKGSVDGPLKSVPQTIYTGGYPTSTGKWLASPVWPVKLDYTIMDVSSEYDWIVVGHRSRSWFWVMARRTTLPKDIIDQALELGKSNGFNIAKIEYPQHIPQPQ
jgi:apolipoprotein D and lipocalin family protein